MLNRSLTAPLCEVRQEPRRLRRRVGTKFYIPEVVTEVFPPNDSITMLRVRALFRDEFFVGRGPVLCDRLIRVKLCGRCVVGADLLYEVLSGESCISYRHLSVANSPRFLDPDAVDGPVITQVPRLIFPVKVSALSHVRNQNSRPCATNMRWPGGGVTKVTVSRERS
jgi:hypothetical protein